MGGLREEVGGRENRFSTASTDEMGGRGEARGSGERG